MLKFNYTNHSIPLSRRIRIFESYDDMMKVIRDGRVIERIVIKDFYSFEYIPSEEIYRIHGLFSIEDSEEEEEGFLDSPAYAFAQFTRDILQIGDQCKFVETAYDVDLKLDKIWGDDGNLIPSTENLKKLKEVYVNIWDIDRTNNQRTASVLCHRVWDFATASEGGDGRCYMTSRYIWIKDADAIDDVLKEAQSINSEIEFIKGHATALMTLASFGSRNPILINDKETLVGFTVINSEFKYSQLVICAYIFIPEYDIQLIGKTMELKMELKHVGNRDVFKEMIKRGVKEILGKGDMFANMFNRLSTCQDRAVVIDYDAVNEKGGNALGVELKMSNKIKQLVQIKERHGYPDTIEGMVYTLMDYATHHAETEEERTRTYGKIMRVLERPDAFMDKLGVRITRASLLELDLKDMGNHTMPEYIK